MSEYFPDGSRFNGEFLENGVREMLKEFPDDIFRAKLDECITEALFNNFGNHLQVRYGITDDQLERILKSVAPEEFV